MNTIYVVNWYIPTRDVNGAYLLKLRSRNFRDQTSAESFKESISRAKEIIGWDYPGLNVWINPEPID